MSSFSCSLSSKLFISARIWFSINSWLILIDSSVNSLLYLSSSSMIWLISCFFFSFAALLSALKSSAFTLLKNLNSVGIYFRPFSVERCLLYLLSVCLELLLFSFNSNSFCCMFEDECLSLNWREKYFLEIFTLCWFECYKLLFLKLDWVCDIEELCDSFSWLYLSI